MHHYAKVSCHPKCEVLSPNVLNCRHKRTEPWPLIRCTESFVKCVHMRFVSASARVVSDTRKYDRGLANLLHDELHWLDVPQRVQYKLYATVHRCRQHKAPQYTTDCCIHTSDIARRQHLRSAGCRQLFATSAFDVRSSGLPFLWLAWRPGTRPQTTFEIRHVLLTVFVSSCSENFSFLVLLAYTVH